MYMILGVVGYARLTSPTAFSVEKKADYAEHQVADGKPLLQYMGPGLDNIELGFSFHADFTDPQASWNLLVELLNAAIAFPVSMGNGGFVGWFVLTRLSRETTITADNGALIGFNCRVQLKEWSDPAPLKTRVIEKKKKAKAVKKKGKKKPKAKKAVVPQLDAASRAAGYKVVNGKTIVRQ